MSNPVSALVECSPPDCRHLNDAARDVCSTCGIPGQTNVNLMAANITSGAAIAAADLLTDLKSGYLLGANPRKQFLEQFAGIFVGTVMSVLCFRIMVPEASALGTDPFPAPAAQTWKGVALAMGQGLSALAPNKVWSIVIGGLVGILLPLLSRLFPKQAEEFMFPVMSGIIAGGSLMGVLLIFWENGPELIKKLFGG